MDIWKIIGLDFSLLGIYSFSKNDTLLFSFLKKSSLYLFCFCFVCFLISSCERHNTKKTLKPSNYPNYNGKIYQEDKNIGSAKDITNGTIYILSIFASKENMKWESKEKNHIIQEQKQALDWISKEALRYGKIIDFKTGTYHLNDDDFKLSFNLNTISLDSIKYSVRKNASVEIQKVLKSKGFRNKKSFISFIQEEHKSTEILIHFFIKGKGRNFAIPATNFRQLKFPEAAILYEKRMNYDIKLNASSIAHETLHLFGAWDLYAVYPNDSLREKSAKEKFPNSILLATHEHISNYNIDKVNAWRIGLKEKEEWYLDFIPMHYFVK